MNKAAGIAFLALALVVAGCSGAETSATQSPADGSVAVTASPTAAAIVSHGPTASPTRTPPAAPCQPLPHAALELERQMPTELAGRPLKTWSMDGELMIVCLENGSSEDVEQVRADLELEGFSLEDVSAVVTGRARSWADPPYFILGYAMNGYAGDTWPDAIALDHPELADLREVEIGDKRVLVGDAASVDQTDHARGRPYIWNSDTVHFVVITDDPAWAEEALAALQ